MKYEICDGTYNQIHDEIWTCLCAMPDTPRGEYDEEIDVVVRDVSARVSTAQIRRTAQTEIDRAYEDGLAIKRVVRGGM